MKKLLFPLVLVLTSAMAFAQKSINPRSISDIKTYAANTESTPESNVSTKEREALMSVQLVQLALSSSNYYVTPGDIYSLSYAAGTQPIAYEVVVDPSYKIRVSNLAVLDAKGKTYVTIKKQVEEIVSKNYPLSGVQFVLIKPACFKVPVIGCVTNSTEQIAWGLSRLSELLESAPKNEYASNRFVDIKSADGTVKTYDLFQTKRHGDYSQDPHIRPGDTVIVRKAGKKIMISGEVVFPDTYELSENENLKELIDQYAGGLGNTADTNRIELSRTISSAEKTGEKIYLSNTDIENDYKLLNLDTIFIESFLNLKPRLYIEGAIYTSTEETTTTTATITPNTSTSIYETFEKGAKYDFFVRSNSSWFGPESDIENAYILRNGEVIMLNIKKILDDVNYSTEHEIVENDVLRIPFKQYFVSVAGSVLRPGLYPYIPDRTYEYYIGLAGGFNKTQNVNKAVKITNAQGKKIKKTEIITPETTITASTNAFLYYFNQVAPVLTTVLSIVSTTLLIKSRL